ncbi:MAG: leucine-rich repeat domain-containing protein [Clostridium sp.]|nr:leucine-rich repeat domain-containing protein [Clostridium sp.]MDY3929020.1 leucine-rich repeat domain-containing protein [Clostridia bacterium]
MKKLKCILSYCVMIVMFVFIFCGINIINVSASERFNTSNGYFEYEIKDNNEITITNYFGTDTELKIPSEIDGKSVTSIGNEAFGDYIGYTSIIIPNSVANIGRGALKGPGSSLTNINVDKENKYFISEDGILFNKDKSELICYPCKKKDESYTIPDSVISIGEYSFYGCSSLKRVIIPNSVVSIGESSFCKCTSLKSIKIPD